jgi:glycosyltransferase involved in cell wall biosynthesis
VISEPSRDHGGALRLVLISPVDPQRARTNTVADVRFCAALSSQGHDVEWVVPTVGSKRGLSEASILSRHDVEYPFRVRLIRTPRRSGPRDVARILPLVFGQYRGGNGRFDHILSRDLRLLLPALVGRRGWSAVPWLHEYRGEAWERFACRRVRWILATNSAIVAAVHADVSPLPALVTGNPVLAERITTNPAGSRRAARNALRLPHNRPVLVYTGKVYVGMKELEYLFYAAERFPNCLVVVTGGQPEAVARLRLDVQKHGLKNVVLTGFFEKPEVASLYQQAGDVLISYYSAHDHRYAAHNLPNKLAEYMATGNPTVVADFPAVRDWATPETAVLVEPDDPQALVANLAGLLSDRARAQRIGAAALELAKKRSYEAVARDVSQFLMAQRNA